ncbi:MAG: BrnT family toxin [Planctomycetes bacterium]|nr:BrnT family toxin [Planctomycetota bacterium]
MNFNWDHVKAERNIEKHKVRFEEAVEVFTDPFIITKYDEFNSPEEDRWLSIGISFSGRILLVSYTMRVRGTEIERDEAGSEQEEYRIISARKATSNEKKEYFKRRGQLGR